MGDKGQEERQQKIEKLKYLKNTLCTERVASSYSRYKHQKDMEAQRAKNASVIDRKRK